VEGRGTSIPTVNGCDGWPAGPALWQSYHDVRDLIKETLALSQRTFVCDDCGFEAGRDVNAATNPARLAASSAVTACGEARSGAALASRVKRASTKQEEKTAVLEAA
jgi:hypothetical protein